MQSDELNNPGIELRNLLTGLYPVGEIGKTFIGKIDHGLQADNEFVQCVYQSSLNYLVRRLIRTAQSIKKNCNGLSDFMFYERLRNFIKSELEIFPGKVEGIFILLIECLKNSSDKPSQKTKDRIIRKAKEQNLKCYFCGCDLDFIQPNLPESAEIEHLWPNSLGGDSSDSNLVVSCRKCNQAKCDYIDSSDFHFEEICLNATDDFKEFSTQMKREYEVALWGKNDFSCTHGKCKSSPKNSGEFTLVKRNYNDSWHFLNIDAYCPQHKP